jgi:hypothetical protein
MPCDLSICLVLKKWSAAAHRKCERLSGLPRGFHLQMERPALYFGHSVDRIWFARTRADQIQEGNPVRRPIDTIEAIFLVYSIGKNL